MAPFKDEYLKMKDTIWNWFDEMIWWWVLYEAEQAGMETQVRLFTRRKTLSTQHGDRRGGQHRQKVQLPERQTVQTVNLMGRRQNLWSGTESLRWFTGRRRSAEKSCVAKSKLAEEWMWSLWIYCRGHAFVAWPHQYSGRGSPHCIGLCRPHSWGFRWLHTIIYNEIWKSARRHIVLFTPFTL